MGRDYDIQRNIRKEDHALALSASKCDKHYKKRHFMSHSPESAVCRHEFMFIWQTLFPAVSRIPETSAQEDSGESFLRLGSRMACESKGWKMLPLKCFECTAIVSLSTARHRRRSPRERRVRQAETWKGSVDLFFKRKLYLYGFSPR